MGRGQGMPFNILHAQGQPLQPRVIQSPCRCCGRLAQQNVSFSPWVSLSLIVFLIPLHLPERASPLFHLKDSSSFFESWILPSLVLVQVILSTVLFHTWATSLGALSMYVCVCVYISHKISGFLLECELCVFFNICVL